MHKRLLTNLKTWWNKLINYYSSWKSSNRYIFFLVLTISLTIFIAFLFNASYGVIFWIAIFTSVLYNSLALHILKLKLYDLRNRIRVESKLMELIQFTSTKRDKKIYVSRKASEYVTKQYLVYCRLSKTEIKIDPEYKQCEVNTNKRKDVIVTIDDFNQML